MQAVPVADGCGMGGSGTEPHQGVEAGPGLLEGRCSCLGDGGPHGAAHGRPGPRRLVPVAVQHRRPRLRDRTREPVRLIEQVERTAARFGIGRGIHLGETILGIKGRVAFEAPAAELLLTAHRELEKLVLTARQLRLKDTVAAVYGDLVHEGQWPEPAARDAEALLARSQERVTGEVDLLLRQGSLFVEGVRSPRSLMAASHGRYGETTGEWTAPDAAGFCRLVALPALLHARAGGDR